MRGLNRQSKRHWAETYSHADVEVIRSAKEIGYHAGFGTKHCQGATIDFGPRRPLRSIVNTTLRSKASKIFA
jgi:hypothetical protein